MEVRKIAQSPPPSVKSTHTVTEAARVMQNARGGAVLVVDEGRLRGILTERDILLRVVAAGRDAETTLVRQVMTSPVDAVRLDDSSTIALDRMISRHIRHLPILDEDGKVSGLISMRNVLHQHWDALSRFLQKRDNDERIADASDGDDA